MKPLVIVTGAFSTGKTTTLRWLAEHRGLRIHEEAHVTVLAKLGSRRQGHPADAVFSRIDEPGHICPMCRPLEFARLVLDEQAAIEERALPWDLLERGYLDPMEMLERMASADVPRPAFARVSHYAKVFLFEIMPALQRPRWSRAVAERVELARHINGRLDRLYRDAGFLPIPVGAGTVEMRGGRIFDILRAEVPGLI